MKENGSYFNAAEKEIIVVGVVAGLVHTIYQGWQVRQANIIKEKAIKSLSCQQVEEKLLDADDKNKTLLLHYHSTKNISPEHLGRALISAGHEGTKAILRHYNAKKISLEHFSEALNSGDNIKKKSLLSYFTRDYFVTSIRASAICIPATTLGKALSGADAETTQLIFQQPNAQDIAAEHLGKALRKADAGMTELLLRHPNAQDITAEHLGKALRKADAEKTALLLQHPNAQNLTDVHFFNALFTSNNDKRGVIFQYIETKAKYKNILSQIGKILGTESLDPELIDIPSQNTSPGSSPVASKHTPSTQIQSSQKGFDSSFPSSLGRNTRCAFVFSEMLKPSIADRSLI